VTLAEVKSHLRLSPDDTTHDDGLTLLMEAATDRVEHDLDKQVVTATYKQTQFDWAETCDHSEGIVLHKDAVQSVSLIQYVDTDGSTQTLATSEYVFDAGRGVVFRAPEVEWPPVQPDNPNAVQVTFVAGYGGPTTVPRIFKQAILLCIGKWFFDPAQEGSALHSQEVAYDRIISLFERAAY